MGVEMYPTLMSYHLPFMDPKIKADKHGGVEIPRKNEASYFIDWTRAQLKMSGNGAQLAVAAANEAAIDKAKAKKNIEKHRAQKEKDVAASEQDAFLAKAGFFPEEKEADPNQAISRRIASNLETRLQDAGGAVAFGLLHGVTEGHTLIDGERLAALKAWLTL